MNNSNFYCQSNQHQIQNIFLNPPKMLDPAVSGFLYEQSSYLYLSELKQDSYMKAVVSHLILQHSLKTLPHTSPVAS